MADDILRICKEQYHRLLIKRKQKLKRLKQYVRAVRLKPTIRSDDDEDLSTRCVDDFFHTLCRNDNKPVNDQSIHDQYASVAQRKREYTIEMVARNQVVNMKNSLIKLIKKRFMIYKQNFKLRSNVSWVKDLPLRPNLNNQIFFSWNNLKMNKEYLHKIYANVFKCLIQDYEVMSEETFTFKVARVLNTLVYSINAIDWGEYNALNFIFRIYKTQKYNFNDMIEEVTSDSPIPSPDPGVLHDNVFSVFNRINYFDYNDNTGEMKMSYDNALFVYRSEIFMFLVAEYVMLRFLLKHASDSVRENIKNKLNAEFVHETYTNNVCQLYPGAFTILFMLYFNSHEGKDPKGILNILSDIPLAAKSADYPKVTKELKYIARFICETVYELEQRKTYISEFYYDKLLSNLSYLKYNFIVQTSSIQTMDDLNTMRYLTR